MGFNTTVVILNDTLHDIERDPNFGKHLSDAVLTKGQSKDRVYCPHQVRIVETHHADDKHLIAVGGNTGVDLGYVGNYLSEPHQMARALADMLGYRLVKKTTKNKR
jgi:hypothetical protein